MHNPGWPIMAGHDANIEVCVTALLANMPPGPNIIAQLAMVPPPPPPGMPPTPTPPLVPIMPPALSIRPVPGAMAT